jgi:trans-aconitate methyltransferase
MTQSWDADRYEESGRFVHEAAADLIEQLDPRPGERILDLGCGTGHLTAEIADRGATPVGVDSDPEMLATAREQHPGIEFRVGDIREVRFDEPFDAVFSNAAFHWVPEAARAAATVAAALKPGGRFVTEFGGEGNVEQIVTAVRAAVSAAGYDDPGHPWYFPSIGEYATLLEARGIELRAARLFDRPIKMDGGERGLREWLAMFGDPMLAAVPESERESVLADVERRLRPALFDPDDRTWTIDYRRIRVRAVAVDDGTERPRVTGSSSTRE